MLLELYNIWNEFDTVPHILLLSGEEVSIPSDIPYFPIETSVLKKEYKDKMLGLDNPFLQEEWIEKVNQKRLERFKGKSKVQELKESLRLIDENSILNKSGHEKVYNSLSSINFWGLDSYEKYLNQNTLIHHPPELWNWVFDKREKLLFLDSNILHYYFLKLQDEISKYIYFGTSAIDGLMEKCGIQNLIEFNGNVQKNRILSKEELIEVKKFSPVIFKDIHNNVIRPDLLLLNESMDINKVITLHLLKIQTDIIIVIGGGRDTNILWKYIENVKKYKKTFVIEFNEHESHILSDLTIRLPLIDAMDTFTSVVIDLQKSYINKYGK